MTSPDSAARGRYKRPEVKWLPRELFDDVLEWCVIPTFDLVVELPPHRGVVIVRRTIAPYENKWALPGLRMLKPEGIDDVLIRIAQDELGLDIETESKRYIGQYVGRFKSEHQRQDISTGYVVRALPGDVSFNRSHFSDCQVIKDDGDIPDNIGAMYKYYLGKYFRELRQN